MKNTTEDQFKNLEESLWLLGLNFSAVDSATRKAYKTFTPPELEECLNKKRAENVIDSQIEEMLLGDSVKRLYAGILLSALDKEQSIKVLNELKADNTEIKVQKPLGHGFTIVAVKHAAQGFLNYGNVRKGFVETAEKLDQWKTAIRLEAQEKNIEAEIEKLPTAERIYAFSEIQQQTFKVKDELLSLAKNDLVSKKFYAAEALQNIDAESSKAILQNLVGNKESIKVLRGDIVASIPVKELALDILDPKVDSKPKFESQNILGKVAQNLSNLFGKNK